MENELMINKIIKPHKNLAFFEKIYKWEKIRNKKIFSERAYLMKEGDGNL